MANTNIEKSQDSNIRVLINGMTAVSIEVKNRVTHQNELKWGFTDAENHLVVEPIYDEVNPFEENGLAMVMLRVDQSKTERFGFINKKGKVISPIIYEIVWSFSIACFAKVRKNGKWGFVNESGEEIIPVIYEFIKPFHMGLAATKCKGKWGYLDTRGEIHIPFLYDDARNFENGTALVSLGGKYIYIDSSGNKTH